MNTITNITNKINEGKEPSLAEKQEIKKAYWELKSLKEACVGITQDTYDYIYLFDLVVDELKKQGMTQRAAAAEAYHLMLMQETGKLKGGTKIVTSVPDGMKRLKRKTIKEILHARW